MKKREGPPAPNAVREHLYSQELPVRERAAEALGRTKSVGAVLALLSALDDRNRYVAIRAAWGLSLISSDVALPYLAKALDAPQPAVVERAAWALGRMDRAARRVLVAALEHSSPIVRKSAAAGLWRHACMGFKSKKVERLLTAMLEGDLGHAAITLKRMQSPKDPPYRYPPQSSFFQRKGGARIR